MTAVIFGANGQDGYYLTRLLKSGGWNVITVSRSGDHLRTDITNINEVGDLFKEYQPDMIFHLAANSTTRHDAMFENHETISTGSLVILEAAKNFSPHSKIFISGSALQFKNNGIPIKETDPFEARDPYSVSRIHSVYAARYYRTLGLKVYVGYFFNHDSPRRSERHVTMKIASTAKRIAAGSNEILEIGDITVVKEWTFAGDVVNGILILMNQDDFFEANISSGVGHSIEEWADECFKIAGLDYRKHTMIAEYFRAEYQSLVSDASLIRSLGFTPQVSLKSLAEMMMNDQ